MMGTMTSDTNDNVTTPIDALRDALGRSKRKRVRRILRTMHPAKVASLLETLTADQRIAVWQQIDERVEHKVLSHLSPAMQAQLTHEAGAGDQGEAPDASSVEQTVAADDSETAAQTQLKLVLDALENGKLKRIGRLFRKLHPARIAGLLESLPASERAAAWDMVDNERTGKVLRHLHEEVRRRLAAEMELDDLVSAARGLEPDDLVDLIQDLPPKLGREILDAEPARARARRVDAVLSRGQRRRADEPDQIAVRADIKVDTLLRYLRLFEDLPPNTDKFFIVDRDNRYQGIVRARRVLTARPETAIADLMETDFEPVQAEQPSDGIARRFEDQDLSSVPVVDATAGCSGASPSTTWSTSSASRPSTRSWGWPASTRRPTCSPRCWQQPAARGLARHQSHHRLPCRLGHRPVRGNAPAGGRTRGADADRRQYGRHRRQPDPDPGHPRIGHRSARPGQHPHPAAQGGRDRSAERPALGLVVAALAVLWFGNWMIGGDHCRRDPAQPVVRGDLAGCRSRCSCASSASTRPWPAASC
jgi:Mg/Co/Ni transporter MgtE